MFLVPFMYMFTNYIVYLQLLDAICRQIVKEDKALVYQDWKECIKPLLGSASFELNAEFFTVDEYFAAKSLIASRSFQIDEYHGSGMVPLADLYVYLISYCLLLWKI